MHTLSLSEEPDVIGESNGNFSVTKEYVVNNRHIRFNNIPRFGHLIQWIKNPFFFKKLRTSGKESPCNTLFCTVLVKTGLVFKKFSN